jgi:hypothetical protein
MKKLYILCSFAIIALFSSFLINSVQAQTYTNVTGTLTDSSTQVWQNAVVTAAFRPTPNTVGPFTNGGLPITDTPQVYVANSGGVFNFVLDTNSAVSPAGSQWTITACPNATVAVCTSVNITIAGASQDISTIMNAALIVPLVFASPVISRAYSDAEVQSGNGGIYWRTTDNTVRGCQAVPNGICTWTAIGGGGGGSYSGYGIDATKYPGADPCLQIQAAIYSAPPAGIVNATSFTSLTPCSVNPFSAPVASNPNNNPTLFTGLPASGLLLMPDLPMPGNVGFFVPNKWSLQGVGGYGTNRTTIEPSTTFLTNHTVISAVGNGSNGCSSTGGQTVTITGTTISNINNLLGMFIQCSSNVSSTAIPNIQNSQVDGIIVAASGTGSGPYTLTLSGAGAAGAITGTGFTINPIIGGWEPLSAAFGSRITQIAFTCETPAATNVVGCFDFVDLSGEESSTLSDVGIINYDTVGLLIATAQAQNGGTFGPITFNSTTTGNNNTIAIELGGTGWNAGGGGGSGLCGGSGGVLCSGPGTRGFHGITISASGTGSGNGGIGFDINSGFVRVTDSHLEFLNQGILIGNSAPVQSVKVENITGCSNSNCALTSVVDISSTYASSASPGPTQNITIESISPQFASTWAVRDFINLIGVSDKSLGTYSSGTNGSSNRTIITNAQLNSCITTGGVVDNNGSHCSPNNVIQIISKQDGIFYSDAFNNNGTTDVCQQINNSLQWAAQHLSLTSGAIFDATGFNQTNAEPCASNPFAGTLGSLIPGSGILKTGQARFLTSVPWIVPVNWIWQGAGGSGIGGTGATGTVLGPNTGQVSTPNYSNDTVTGSVTTVLNSNTLTGSGTSFTSANVGHYILVCSAPPCTNQSAMAGGIITSVSSTTVATMNVPAQATVSAGLYTITPPLVVNNGVIRDVGLDGNSYGTGGGNFNGGLIGLYQTGGTSSFVENITFGHFNSGGIHTLGFQNGTLRRIYVFGNGIANSVFSCITSPQGVNIDELTCQSGNNTNPTLSYGVFTGGNGSSIRNVTLQNVNVGVEEALSATFSTNNITLNNIVSGSGGSGVGTLVELGGVTGGSTSAAQFSTNIFGLNCPSGCGTILNDHLTSNILTDAILDTYILSRTYTTGNHYIFSDSDSIPQSFLFIPHVLAQGTGNVGGSTTITSGSCAQLLSVQALTPIGNPLPASSIGGVSWAYAANPQAQYNNLIVTTFLNNTSNLVLWDFCNPTASTITLSGSTTQITYQIYGNINNGY